MKKPDWFNLDNYSKIYELNHIEQLFLFKRKSEIIEDLRNYGLTPRCTISTQAVDQWKNYQSIIEAGASFSQEDFEDANQFFQDYENGLVCDANIHQFSVGEESEQKRFEEHLNYTKTLSSDQRKELLFLQLDLTKPAALIKQELKEIVNDLYKHEKLIPFSKNPLGPNERAKGIRNNQIFPYMDLMLSYPEKKFTPTELGQLLHAQNAGDPIKAGNETTQRFEQYILEKWF